MRANDFLQDIRVVLTWVSLKTRNYVSTDLKSRYDEEKSLREAADEKLAKLNEQLQKEKQENERLQTELVQYSFLPRLDFVLCIDPFFYEGHALKVE